MEYEKPEVQMAYEHGFSDGCRLAVRTILAKVCLVLNEELNLDDEQMSTICKSINDRLAADVATRKNAEGRKE